VFTARYRLNILHTTPPKPSGYFMYHQFNIHKLYVLPTQCIYVYMCGSENKQLLFPYTALPVWRVKEERTILQTIKRRRANWIGHIFQHAAAQSQPGRDTVTLPPPSAQRDTPLMALSGREASQFLPVPSGHPVNCPVSPTFHSTAKTRRLSTHFLLDHPGATRNGTFQNFARDQKEIWIHLASYTDKETKSRRIT
jgi:hypothetical protein